MMNSSIIILSLIIAFLIGSIPNGYLIGIKFKGIDIRTMGSGNIGSTNVRRILGNKLAVITQILDITKGLAPVGLAYIVAYNYNDIYTIRQEYLNLVALFAILGHNYTPFLSFNGGKGVNTTIGAFFLLTPIATLSGVLVYFLLKPFIQTVAIRSIALGLTIPIISFVLNINTIVIAFSSIACIILIIRHKKNIENILASKKDKESH